MQIVEIPLDRLREAPWNPNQMDENMLSRLRQSIRLYRLVQNLVVQPLDDSTYEVLSGNQRLRLLKELGFETVPCAVVHLDDAHACLLAQALNHVHGEDDLGLRAEAVREILRGISEEQVLAILPETAQGLRALSNLGQQDMAEHLRAWQLAQAAKLRHLQFQLTPAQLEVVQKVLKRILSTARDAPQDSPNARGTALFILCEAYLEHKEGS